MTATAAAHTAPAPSPGLEVHHLTPAMRGGDDRPTKPGRARYDCHVKTFGPAPATLA